VHILSQGLTTGRETETVIAVLLALCAILGIALFIERRSRRRLEAEVVQAIQAQQQSMQGQAQAMEAAQQREQVMFDQHKSMNQLTIDKVGLELQALQTQLKLMETDLRRRGDAGEYHAAMMEKTRLELESLKLHIREQRKRLDDYGQYED